MKKFHYSYVYIGLAVLGVLGGFLYWHFWGCTDSCPIDSSWKWSVARGGVIGLCIAAVMQPNRRKQTRVDDPQ